MKLVIQVRHHMVPPSFVSFLMPRWARPGLNVRQGWISFEFYALER
eukprot:SAG22_NODE_1251_length_5005_cov_22.891154_6_plen_46_part_00